MEININSYYAARREVYDRIQNANTAKKVVLALFMAALTGIGAQIIIPLSWTPVPITLQTFAVILSGLVLGKKYGLLSQIFYLALGITLIPWFSGFGGGLDAVLGSNMGYFIGFLLVAYFVGYISEKYSASRKFSSMIGIVSVATFGLIYIPGLIGLALTFYFTKGVVLGVGDLVVMGLAPFIIGDILKILGAGFFSKVFLPK